MLKGAIDILINDNDVAEIVGLNKAGDKVKVYPGICPEPEQAPFLVLRIMDAPDFASSKGQTVDTRDFAFDVYVYTRSYELLDEITDAVKAALDQASGTHNGIDFDEIRYVTFSDGYADDYQLYTRTIAFLAVVKS